MILAVALEVCALFGNAAAAPQANAPPAASGPGKLEITYDRFTDETTVFLRLTAISTVRPDLTFALGPITFKGRLPQYNRYKFDFYLGPTTGQVILLIDSDRWIRTNPTEGGGLIARWVLARIIESGTTDGRIGQTEFTFTSAHKVLLKQFLSAVTPSDYDRNTVEVLQIGGAPIAQTVAYINVLLSQNPDVCSSGNVCRTYELSLQGNELAFTTTEGAFQTRRSVAAPYLDLDDITTGFVGKGVFCRGEKECAYDESRGFVDDRGNVVNRWTQANSRGSATYLGPWKPGDSPDKALNVRFATALSYLVWLVQSHSGN
jgi:hypothetical protein